MWNFSFQKSQISVSSSKSSNIFIRVEVFNYRKYLEHIWLGITNRQICWQISSLKKAHICSIFWFPWCIFSQHGQFLASNIVSLKIELGRNAQNRPSISLNRGGDSLERFIFSSPLIFGTFLFTAYSFLPC